MGADAAGPGCGPEEPGAGAGAAAGLAASGLGTCWVSGLAVDPPLGGAIAAGGGLEAPGKGGDATAAPCREKGSEPEGPEKEVFLCGAKGTLALRKPGSDSRLEEARRGPGGGADPPRNDRLPPELMEAARRLCS